MTPVPVSLPVDPNGDVTHHHLLDDFADHQRAAGLAQTTIRNRSSVLRTAEAACGPLHEATTLELRRFLGAPGLTPGTRRTYRSALRAFYAFLADEGVCQDPTARLAPVRVARGQPRPFTQEQVDRMLSSGAYRRTRAMILLGYYQGFRVSSIAAVHGHDVDLIGMTIRTVGKGGKDRTLPLHPTVAELAETMPRDGWWFPARGGRDGHVSGHSVSELVTRAKRRAGITDPKLTAHSLRHGFGTDLVEEGVDIRVVQELMMHESLATTQIYTGVSEHRKREGLHALPPRTIPVRSGRRAA
ncbi:tyrosine recombinase [Curtobacterium sp. MCBD17_032]|nr:tyrosine recombinase [Curtobacterium sp. MCBD17_032]